MNIEFLIERFKSNQDKEAIISKGRSILYSEFLTLIEGTRNELAVGLRPGSVVALEADFSPKSVAALLALISSNCIFVPQARGHAAHKEEFYTKCQIEQKVIVHPDDSISIESISSEVSQPLLQAIKTKGTPGLILYSSGSSGLSKVIVHDFVPMLEKYREARRPSRIMTFLLFDHWGGINTALHSLASGGTIITIQERSPEAICAAIQQHRVEIMPVTPTFINLLLLSEAFERYDLSSLKLITYGTEVMPESTLKRLSKVFPNLKLKQTYGLSEIGVLPTQSESNNSLWLKIGGNGFETRVRDGLLEIKSASSMLGYLDTPSPFTEDGWLMTGDAVEEKDGYIKIVGRRSGVINVGGQKVHPAEVESVLLQMPGIIEVAVSGKPNPITGQMVYARVRLADPLENLPMFRARMATFCKERLSRYKIPQKVELVRGDLHSDRFKKLRV